MAIGFFDSGVGGLSVLAKARMLMPQEDYIYYADVDHVPYGNKSHAEIMAYTLAACDFLLAQGVDALVIACNTATSVAVSALRARYPALVIIGMEPAVKPAIRCAVPDCSRVVVTATPVTLRLEKLYNLITSLDHGDLVDLLALPELVDFAEKRDFSSPAVVNYLQEVLSPYLTGGYAALVLGCTHFLYFKPVLEKLLPPTMQIIDGADGTVRNLQSRLEKQNLLQGSGTGHVEYYHSGRLVDDAPVLAYYGSLLEEVATY